MLRADSFVHRTPQTEQDVDGGRESWRRNGGFVDRPSYNRVVATSNSGLNSNKARAAYFGSHDRITPAH